MKDKFDRITELMRNKGVPHEAFELLADIHKAFDSQYQRGRKDQQEEFIKQNKPNIEKLKDIGGLLIDVYNDMDAQKAIIELDSNQN